jgi:hypothetical protein
MLITLAGTLAAQQDPLGKYYVGRSCAKGRERQLSQLAQNVARNPNDVRSRLLFAECSSLHEAIPADRWAHWRKLRVQYVLWLTEHFPESQGLAGGMPRLDPVGSGETTAEEYQLARDIRIRLADKEPGSADLQANTAYFFTFHELFLAEKYYRRALVLEPKAWIRSYELGSLYAHAILWADGRPKGVTYNAPPPDLHSFSMHALVQLRLTGGGRHRLCGGSRVVQDGSRNRGVGRVASEEGTNIRSPKHSLHEAVLATTHTFSCPPPGSIKVNLLPVNAVSSRLATPSFG